MTTLRRGARGPAVTDLQNLLYAAGQHIKIDGDFGEITERAVRNFQQQRGLTVDGVVGPQTMAALQGVQEQPKSAGDAVATPTINRTAFYGSIRTQRLFSSLAQAQVDGMNALLDAFDAAKSPIQYQAYMLATTYHETSQTMQPIIERGQRSYFNMYEPGTKKGKDLGNISPGDGYLYRGRGYVQLTGKANYIRAGNKTGVDLVGNPDLALLPETSAKIMILGMAEGWFTSKKLSDYIGGSRTDYVNARRIINGTDKAQTIAGYADQFERALRAKS